MIIIRIWHKSLIPYLPRQQLLGQWRECCCIAKAVQDGNLNHILVNRVKGYPIEHLYAYGVLVGKEMERRGIKVNPETFLRYFYDYEEVLHELPGEEIFPDWHNRRYFWQCLYNLEEKHDCQGVTDDEWNVLLRGYKEITGKDWE